MAGYWPSSQQVRRSFFSVVFMPYNKSFIDRTSLVDFRALKRNPGK